MKHRQDCIWCIYNCSQSEGVPGWVQLSSVRDSFLVWGDRHLEPSFSGRACPSWCWKGSSLLSLAPVSRAAPSTAPTVGPTILQWAIWRGRAGPNSRWKLLALSHTWHPESPGSWPLNRLSSRVRKLIVPFSLHCQRPAVLQITGQISKADTGSPWDAVCYPEIPS